MILFKSVAVTQSVFSCMFDEAIKGMVPVIKKCILK